MTITEEDSRPPGDIEVVKAGMRRHTELCAPWNEYKDVTVFARSDDGKVIGAGLGESGRGWLHISVVWVDESASYQARPFYGKPGYTVFGTLNDYPPGHRRFFMSRELKTA